MTKQRLVDDVEVFMLAVAVIAWAAGRDRVIQRLSAEDHKLVFESFFALPGRQR
jgi:hypothetical protein